MAINIEIFGMSAIAIALMVFIISIIFMAAQLFRRPEWEAYAKLELYQVFVSVLIIVFIAAIAGFAEEFSYALAGNDPFTVAYDYLNSMVFQKTIPAIINLRGVSITAQYWGGLYAKYGSSNWGVQFQIVPGMNALESSIEFLINVLSPFAASLMVQQIGLQIIQGSMFSLVLPLGLFLRIFPQTREAGVFLIATAFGFYVVFPLTYVMHYNVISYLESTGQQASAGGWIANAYASPDVVGMLLAPDLGITSTLVMGSMTRLLFISLTTLSFTITQAVFLPALSMIITTSFIKTTAKFLSQKFE